MIDQERLRVYEGLTDLYKLILEKRRLKEHYENKFLQIRPNDPKTAKIYELNRIFHPFWAIVRDIPNVFPIQVLKALDFGPNVRK